MTVYAELLDFLDDRSQTKPNWLNVCYTYLNIVQDEAVDSSDEDSEEEEEDWRMVEEKKGKCVQNETPHGSGFESRLKSDRV